MVKGFANHKRIQIMELLQVKPELSLVEISESLKIQFKNTSQHVSKLAIAGLVLKRSDGTHVRHKLTDRAKHILKFLRNLD
jgi:DNA-binding transcriptional ArsR family regulator